MKSAYRVLLLLTTILFISGCSLIPGSYLSTSDKEYSGDEATSLNHRVTLYPITPLLIQQQKEHPLIAQPNVQLEQKIKQYEYRIGVGDVLNITVWNHPELTIPAGSYRSATETGNWVHSDGTIFYPYIGQIAVAGKTVAQIRSQITKKLADYIQSPQVDISIAAFRSKKIYISGEVVKPGTQALTNIPLTLLDAFNQAGGLTADADWEHVSLTRHGQEFAISLRSLIQYGDLTQNELLLPEDILYVPRNDHLKVFVMGEVNRPSTLKIDRSGMSLTEALSSSEGINQGVADATGVFVIRPLPTKTPTDPIAAIYQLDLSDATALVMGTEFQLKPYDAVYVTAVPIARWNRLIVQLIPTISGFNELSEGSRRVRNWTQ